MLNITLAKKDVGLEFKAKEQLERLLEKYDLEKYFFTKDIIFSSYTMPSSHPVLTLNTRYFDGDDDGALAGFIHEELHWFLNIKNEETKKVVEELKKIYKDVPVGYPEGAKNEISTYEHLIINTLEYVGIKGFIGVERAKVVIGKKDYYKWIYKTILEDNQQLLTILKKNKLLF